ncbi:MAG: MFS transporter [Actinomycetota bacterium]
MTSPALPQPAPRSLRPQPLWVIIAAGSVITALSLGVRSTFGLFLDPVIDSIGSGRGAFALAVAIQNLVWGLSQPVAGAFADRYGSGRVLGAGGLIYAAGMVLMSTATSTGSLYLSAGFIVGIGTGAASFAVVLAALGRIAPPERRSMALGIATAMGSVGQFLLVPTAQRLIDGRGWEAAAVVLGLVILAVLVFAPALRGSAADHTDPSEGAGDAVPLRTELRRASHSGSYRMLNLAFFVCGFHVTFVATHLASYAEDVGQTREIAASALALIGLFNIFGSLTAGALGGRYSKSKLLSIIYALRAVVFAGFVLLPTGGTTTLVFGALIGLLWLSTVPLTSGIVVSQFGTAHAGTLFGIVFLSHQVGAFVGAWMGGSLADRAGSYDPVWWISVGLGVMAAALHLVIDEGPQPDPPVRTGLSPAPLGGAAALLALVGTAAVLTVGSAAASAEDGGATEEDVPRPTPQLFCPIHPIQID